MDKILCRNARLTLAERQEIESHLRSVAEHTAAVGKILGPRVRARFISRLIYAGEFLPRPLVELRQQLHGREG